MKKTTVAEIARRMIEEARGNLHDIAHFMKVYAYAGTIGHLEKLDSDTQETLEIAALLHDIACPLCREKYGSATGKRQEAEGQPLARALLQDLGVEDAIIDRVVFLVGHHHTYTNIDNIDHQILLEADFLVNAEESELTKMAIQNAKTKLFKTKSGTAILDAIYLYENPV